MVCRGRRRRGLGRSPSRGRVKGLGKFLRVLRREGLRGQRGLHVGRRARRRVLPWLRVRGS